MSQTQTRRSSQVDLLHGPILKSLLLFALPIMASRVFQQIYNTMDTLIVGYTLGDSSIAAMGACSSIYEMMTGFTFGVGNGLAIVTARCFGRQETERMKKSVASCIVIGITVTLVVTVLATIFMHPLLRLLKISDRSAGEPAHRCTTIGRAAKIFAFSFLKSSPFSLRPSGAMNPPWVW